jgi:lipopolysaccharide transport system ATP-binding protein
MQRIGLWGTFDVQNYGDALFPRIGRMELRRRLPHARVWHFSPLGREHPTRFDGGEPAEPLGRYAPERLAALAEQLDCVIVGPGEIIHDHDWELAPHYGRSPEELTDLGPSRYFIEGLGPELEAECPVLWHAVGLPFDIPSDQRLRYREALSGRPYVSVRDDISRERLAAAGVDRQVEVVPDPALLVNRLFPQELLDRRLRYLRAIGAYPVRGPALVVQGSRTLVESVPELAPAIAAVAEELGVPVAVVETGPSHGDGEFAEALAARLPGETHRVTNVGVEDLAAAIGASAGFIGNSLHGNITAFVYGRPHVILGMSGSSKLQGFAAMVEAEEALAERPDAVPASFRAMAELGPRPDVLTGLQRRVEKGFDRLAEIARAAAARRIRPDAVARSAGEIDPHMTALYRAFEARGRRLALQRWRMADRVAEIDRQARELAERLDRTEAQVAELKVRNEELDREVGGKQGELERLMNTKTFRYTAGLRRGWARARGLWKRT